MFDNIANNRGLKHKTFGYVVFCFDTSQHTMQGLCLLTQLIPSSYRQSISQIHHTVPKGKIKCRMFLHFISHSALYFECSQFTIIATMNNTATMSWNWVYPSNIIKLCILNSLYSKCIFADNYTWCIKKAASCMQMISGRLGNVL